MTQNERGSREAVLDAAEVLFAEQGHDGTSIEEIGRNAGLSRGSPGYLFWVKARLVPRCSRTRYLSGRIHPGPQLRSCHRGRPQ